ncbi:hypothetical protein ACP4OV_030430 [Aristida adscensionis]
MAGAASSRRARRGGAAAPVLPDDVAVWEILVRLPAKELLRCRAVCRSWRRLTSAADFLLAHHRRQPSLPLAFFHSRSGWGPAAVDAFDVRRAPAERRPVLGFDYYSHHRGFTLHASCDGLLLLSLCSSRFYICNPATRHWAALPKLTGCSVSALYRHSLSGDYRILYWKGHGNAAAVYYVLTVGSSEEPRCIGLPVELQSLKQVIRWGLNNTTMHPPVLLHNCLHWVARYMILDKLIIFDTVVESFRGMYSPTGVTGRASLLEMNGTLGISLVNGNSRTTGAVVWVLQDYKMELWSMKYKIEFPLVEISRITERKFFYVDVVSENGDMLLTCGCSVPWYMFHIDSKGKLLEKYRWDDIVSEVIGHSFKESLVRHSFFQKRDDGSGRLPLFFRGL